MTVVQLVQGFWAHLAMRRKRQLMVLLVLMILASFSEVLSLGAVLPFLGVLTKPETVFTYPAIQPLLGWMNITSPQALLLPITVSFIVAALVAGGTRLVLLYVQTRLSFAIGADFSYQIYRRTLYQSYAVHVSRNSSEVISGVTTKVNMIIYYFLLPILTLVSSAVILFSILAALLAVNPLMSLVACFGFGAIYTVIVLATRKHLAVCSQRISTESNRVVKILQEGLGGIRDVLLDGSQEVYCRQYRQADILLRYAQSSSSIIGGVPRFVAEALGMVLIAILAYILAQHEDVADTIALLGVLALGAQRLLPVLQQGYSSIVQLRSARHSLQDALGLLNQPINTQVYELTTQELPFEDSIRLEHVGFHYEHNLLPVLKDLNLTIPRGSRIGFIGTTGSGKSTLLDIVMGLLNPTSGRVYIDGIPLSAATQRAWQRRIAHVPQSIYLIDGSITENIAFGMPNELIDLGRVRRAARQAQIADYIESLENGYDTHVGERGVRLSGGQRQRIGIARALYKQAEIIVLDEASSALDNSTEQAVMDSIRILGPQHTILMVAHRITTLRDCDQIVELQRGEISNIGLYSDFERSGAFVTPPVK